MFDPRVYDAMNIGRFVNQGERIKDIKAIVAACDIGAGSTAYQRNIAEVIFDAACNFVYSTINVCMTW